MDVMTVWTGPALVGVLTGLLAVAFWSLGRAPVRLWRMRDERRSPGYDGAQTPAIVGAPAPVSSHAQAGIDVVPRINCAPRPPVGGAPFVPREVVVDEGGATTGASATPGGSELMGMDIAREVQRLAALSTPQEEIACRVGIALAEVRLLIAMQTARVSRHGSR